MATPNVAFVRRELKDLLPSYQLIADCVAGEVAVKAAGIKYLPMPDPENTDASNIARYKAYKTRAVFYNVTRNTLSGLVGQVFLRDPEIKVPASLDSVIVDATGNGISFVQLIKRTVEWTVAYSRSGLFVDYTRTEADAEGVTAKEIQEGKARPFVTAYKPFQIVNWREIEDGATKKLSLVVLLEPYNDDDDGFEVKVSAQFRELRLDESGFYFQRIWREEKGTTWNGIDIPTGNFLPQTATYPTDASGNKFKEIPFKFIGSSNNDSEPDSPNLYDMASINIAHYRNSADYEEACYVVGQVTPYATGLTKEWVDKVLKGKLAFGSRGGIPLPAGADIGLLQAEENSMIKEAMDTKERQMVALGAKIVQEQTVQRTATDAKIENSSESSVLSSISENNSVAAEWALKKCLEFQPGAGEVVFKLNKDFDINTYGNEVLSARVKDWQAGAITFEEMRAPFRKAGVATEEDEEAKNKIAAATAAELTLIAETSAPPDNVGK